MTTDGWSAARFADGGWLAVTETVVREVSIPLIVDGTELVRLLALPEGREELALGFLLSEGLIESAADVAALDIVPQSAAVLVRLARPATAARGLDPVRSVTTGCGRGITFLSPLAADRFPPVTSQGRVSPAAIVAAMRLLQRGSDLFRRTGGVHTAALAEAPLTGANGQPGPCLLRVSDDIGRHNAIDKVLGWALRHRWPPGERDLLLTTGRLSSEIVVKAARGRVPFLVSHSAPTVGALQLADRLGLTVIGFVRGERFNVYTHPERVIGAPDQAGAPGGPATGPGGEPPADDRP